MIRHCIIFILVLSSHFTYSQVFPIVHDADSETLFISAKGEVAFTLPVGHRAVTEFPSGGYIIMVDDNVNLDAFPSGICPVQRPDNSFYWINEKGKVVHDFGKKYSKMSPFAEGLCLAWEKIDGKKEAYLLIYLDMSGNNAFGTKKFWEADPFNEGLAAVQLEDQNGKWGWIDKKGEMVASIGTELKGTVSSIDPFQDGLSRVFMKGEQTGEYSYTYRSYFVDTKGNVVLDLEKIFPDTYISNVYSFSEGLAAVSLKKPGSEITEMVFIDKNGNRQGKSYDHTSRFSPFKKNLAAVGQEIPTGGNYFKNKNRLIDKEGNEVMPATDSAFHLIHYIDVREDYYMMLGMERNVSGFTTAVVSRKSNTPVFYARDGEMVACFNDYMLIKYKSRHEFELIKLPSTSIWKTPASLRVFTTLSEALRQKESATRLDLFSNFPVDSAAMLGNLKQLQKISISFSKIKQLPAAMARLPRLHTLQLMELENLKSLPADGFKSLKKLDISDCAGLQGIEQFIESHPSLTEVSLTNVDLKEGFEEKMKKQRPSLKIYSSSSFSMGLF